MANGNCFTYFLEFLVRHGFKHFPRDSVTSEVGSVVLGLSLGEDIGYLTITLLLNYKKKMLNISLRWNLFPDNSNKELSETTIAA